MTFSPDPPPSASALPADDSRYTVFYGRFGLRAGWGIALYVALATAFIALTTIVFLASTGKLKHIHKASATQHSASSANASKPEPQPEPHAGPTLLTEAGTFGGLLLTSLLLTRIEKRPIGLYGLGRRRAFDLLPGALSGLASLSLLVFVLHAAHLLVFDGRALFGPAILLNGILWLLAFFFVGCFEEYFFRGYIQYTLTRGLYGLAERISLTHTRGIAFLLASVVTSLIFFAAHTGNGGETRSGLAAVFVAGVVFTYALWRTGSLWWGIGYHMAWDWAQSFLYGVPDSGNVSFGRLFNTHPVGNPLWSGGTAGPEGSLLVIPTLLLLLVAIRFTPAGTQPRLEPDPRSFPHAEPEASPSLA